MARPRLAQWAWAAGNTDHVVVSCDQSASERCADAVGIADDQNLPGHDVGFPRADSSRFVQVQGRRRRGDADVVRSPRSYDTGLLVMFGDRAALDAYQKHPQHVPVAEFGVSLSDHIV